MMPEKDQSADAEMDAAWQQVSYIVIGGSGNLTADPYNLQPTATPTISQTPTITPTPDGTVIGETGRVSNVDADGVTVTLNHTYIDPVVIAQPGSYEDGEVALARITGVTSGSFTVKMAEPAAGSHGDETVHYLVIESGSWELADGTHVEAGTVETNATIGKNITDTWETVYYQDLFSSDAVVLSQVQSSNGQGYVDTRMTSISTDSFQVAMEEQESATSAHATESIGWVAWDEGTGEWNGKDFEAYFSGWDYYDVWQTLSFVNTYNDPIFLAMENYDVDTDPIHLRYDNLDGDSVDLLVQEDQSADSEMEVDWWQQVSYFVMDGFSDLTGSVYVPPQSNAGGMKLARPVLEEATPTPTETPTATPTQQANTFTGAAYTYDGDGNMVKSVIDGVITYYVGGYYELKVEGQTETEIQYYYAASLRIAMRTDGILNWLFSDHLSSTTIITDESGTVVSEMKYTAFGEVRSENGVSPTDYTYTGQRYEAEFGLSYYVARWYDPQISHFVQADSLIPQPGNALDWDRYAYVLWNPMRYHPATGGEKHIPNRLNLLFGTSFAPKFISLWSKRRRPEIEYLFPIYQNC